MSAPRCVSIVCFWILTSLSLVSSVNNHETSGRDPFIKRSKRDHWTQIGPEVHMTTPEIINHRGYPVEIHHIVTDDGYILELHRIPWSKKAPIRNHLSKKPVLLQHGLFADDHVWLITPENKALAYVLADRGYDVWLANSRGSIYSRNHVTYEAKSKEFWDFSWDELGKYDIPATINYILKMTRQTKLSFIGHSIAFGLLAIALNEYPDLNRNLESVIALAPASHLANTRMLRETSPVVDISAGMMNMVGMKRLDDHNGMINKNLRNFCGRSDTTALTCRDAYIFRAFGENPEGFDMRMLQTILHHFPSGTSMKALIHAIQNYHSGKRFVRFNHGIRGNLERYGTITPPEYDMKMVTAPVYIFWSYGDPVTPPQDVQWMAESLSNLRASIPVKDPFFSHGDFVWSPSAVHLLYIPLLNYLPPPN